MKIEDLPFEDKQNPDLEAFKQKLRALVSEHPLLVFRLVEQNKHKFHYLDHDLQSLKNAHALNDRHLSENINNFINRLENKTKMNTENSENGNFFAPLFNYLKGLTFNQAFAVLFGIIVGLIILGVIILEIKDKTFSKMVQDDKKEQTEKSFVIKGTVLYPNNSEASNVEVRAGTVFTRTDSKGIFSLKGIKVGKDGMIHFYISGKKISVDTSQYDRNADKIEILDAIILPKENEGAVPNPNNPLLTTAHKYTIDIVDSNEPTKLVTDVIITVQGLGKFKSKDGQISLPLTPNQEYSCEIIAPNYHGISPKISSQTTTISLQSKNN